VSELPELAGPTTAIGSCLLDAQGRVCSIDAAFARWFDPPPRVGQRLELAGLALDGRSEVARIVRRATTLELRCTPLDAAAAPLALQVVLVPLHEHQHELELALALARETLRSLVDASPITIVTTHLDMTVSMWNRAGEQMFGWREDEVVGRPYPLVPPLEQPEFGKLVAKVHGGQGFTGVEAERRRKDGTLIPVRMHTAPLRDVEGKVVGGLALLEDLSHTRELERQKMEAIGRLAGGVAHDFNNLLAIILGMTELLGAEPSLGPRAREHVAEIRRTSEAAKRITSQLLAVGRRNAALPARTLDVHASVRSSAPLLSRLIGDAIKLELALAEGSANVAIDGAQLEQVLLNLAVNARDAMPEGGVLTIRSRRQPSGDALELELRDTGTGIPPDVLPRLFEPFFTTKGEGRGTGLGLATVFGIVRASGGSIRVDSQLGRGTAFVITLPLRAATPASVATPSRPTLPRGSERLLVVDDEPSVRRSMARLLASLGYAVDTAADGSEALAALQAGARDLVLTDLSMPRMTGEELAHTIHEIAPHLPIVFMSGNLDSEPLRAKIVAGELEFLQKPVALAELAACIRRVLDRSPAQPSARH
jgi:PAS domain S-box-containing protein